MAPTILLFVVIDAAGGGGSGGAGDDDDCAGLLEVEEEEGALWLFSAINVGAQKMPVNKVKTLGGEPN
jgi:hypothetical protein